MKTAFITICILVSLVGCALFVSAQSTTNLSVTLHTNDLRYLTNGVSIEQKLQQAADAHIKHQQRQRLIQLFDRATPAQRRALINWIEANLQ